MRWPGSGLHGCTPGPARAGPGIPIPMKGTVMRYAKKSIVTLFAGAAMVTAVAAPASAAGPQNQDGLVNVAVGDVTILQDVNVAAVVGVAANVCDVTVGPVSAAIL